jgi:hypothetical protein
LLFRSEEHIDKWCEQKGAPRGAVLSLEESWQLAKGWYHDRLRPDWRRKTPEEAEAFFNEHGLTDPFWRLSVKNE